MAAAGALAALLLLGSAAGGFAVGRATGPDGDRTGVPGAPSGYGPGDGEDRGFPAQGGPDGDGPAGGFPAAPDGTLPDGTAPDGTAPGGTAPGGTAPDVATPGATTDDDASGSAT
ncbi:MAG: hypothetical protein JHD04_13815 [Nocardioides sp.]|nr:hypothetical protein [Nocardioides sp.]